jgi:hypothetical protein
VNPLMIEVLLGTMQLGLKPGSEALSYSVSSVFIEKKRKKQRWNGHLSAKTVSLSRYQISRGKPGSSE